MKLDGEITSTDIFVFRIPTTLNEDALHCKNNTA